MCSSGSNTASSSTGGLILLIRRITAVITPILEKKTQTKYHKKGCWLVFSFNFLKEKLKVLLELTTAEQFGGFHPGLEMEMLGLPSRSSSDQGVLQAHDFTLCSYSSPRPLCPDSKSLDRAWEEVKEEVLFMPDNFKDLQ